ncbi:MAG: electron transfer flavoprotein subunit alpha/FixB family protein, partial [Dehalococcoidia bacterium]
MTETIWVIGQSRAGAPSSWTTELVAAGRELAGPLGAEVAVLIDECAGVEELGELGADRAVIATGAGDAPPVETFVTAMNEAADGTVAFMLLPDNIWGRDLGSRLAAGRGAPLLTACERLGYDEGDGALRVVRACLAGRLSTELRFVSHHPCVLTVREHTFQATKVSERSKCPVSSVSAAPDVRIEVLDRRPPDPDTLDLGDAEVIVSGGRGAGGGEGFRLLADLARMLGGTTAASRVAVDLGWMPRTRQVGQTGSRVAPQLYVACGISGAREHMVGIRDAASLIAINTD